MERMTFYTNPKSPKYLNSVYFMYTQEVYTIPSFNPATVVIDCGFNIKMKIKLLK